MHNTCSGVKKKKEKKKSIRGDNLKDKKPVAGSSAAVAD